MGNELANELQSRLNDPGLAQLLQRVDAGTASAQDVHDWVSAHRGQLEQLLLDALPAIPGLQAALPADLPVDGWRPRIGFAGSTIGIDSLSATVSVGGAPIAIGLLPPSGASLELNAGPAVASGMVERRPPDGADGALGVRLGPINLNAFALLDGLSGTVSLAVVLGLHFAPPIQLSFGFALSAIGGVIGVNRSIDADALRARLADGSALDALFPDDPVADAPRLLTALGSIFPVTSGQEVVGPTYTITWLDIGVISIVRADLGLLLQLPEGKVVIVGRAKVDLGPVLALRLDVVGSVEPSRGLVAIDAVLVDSRALAVFRVTGSSAFRLSTGSPPYQVASVGGFYPGFDPKPAVVPPQQRLGLALDFPCPLTIRAGGYLAITSNTFQTGADIEVGIDLSVISAHGYMRFDAIVHFDPFHIHADYEAGFEVSVAIFSGGTTVSGWIDGPGPWAVHARVSISLLIHDFTWSDTFHFGPGGPPPDPPIEHLVDVLAPTLGAPSHLRAADAHDPHVAIRATPGGLDGGMALCSPLATLSWAQSAVPIDLPVVQAGGRPLASQQSLSLSVDESVVTVTGDANDWFAPGMFLDLTAAAAMLLPPFQLLKAGVGLELALNEGASAAGSTDYRTFVRERPDVWNADVAGFVGALLTPARALAMAAARSAPPVVDDRSPLVRVSQETWAVTANGATGPQPSAAHAYLASSSGGGVAHALADTPIAVGAL